MGSDEALMSTALRFLHELNHGEMGSALQDGFLLLSLMAGDAKGREATRIVLPTPPPRKADKYQVAPFIR